MIQHSIIRIHGKVQGVFFRKSTKEKADELGVVGYVKNESDGTVSIEAEGEESALQQFIEWCNQGPLHANVENVETEAGEPKHFESFDVL
ncbi:MAG: acylphosphatase [Candidatus Jacksonbacteria bacterium]|jgi:acylphosphatase|nr:acylphosphatase [Candidatus Jacksonbacteria bacterium]MBT6034797.1 acylphosphatase [Candidatus Jacksonbacteria bacterium]MBT6301649.1 acylphosphatase [Candidatus Jacksonbacteria bacterium]MBT6757462.1 acylphosphatase [Candidatus Jacksonbacteria bacterium]MBT6955212.1 acylphosphatase [Candidatus Jacksonbacteria bacterium]